MIWFNIYLLLASKVLTNLSHEWTLAKHSFQSEHIVSQSVTGILKQTRPAGSFATTLLLTHIYLHRVARYLLPPDHNTSAQGVWLQVFLLPWMLPRALLTSKIFLTLQSSPSVVAQLLITRQELWQVIDESQETWQFLIGLRLRHLYCFNFVRVWLQPILGDRVSQESNFRLPEVHLAAV